MSNMSPFEIRLEILKMAQSMLEQDYYGKREQILNEYNAKCELSKIHGTDLPIHPGYPAYPSEQEVITKAQILNGFVSNIPVETKVTNKKTT